MRKLQGFSHIQAYCCTAAVQRRTHLTLLVPGIVKTSSPCAWTQASASWLAVQPLRSAMAFTEFTSSRFCRQHQYKRSKRYLGHMALDMLFSRLHACVPQSHCISFAIIHINVSDNNIVCGNKHITMSAIWCNGDTIQDSADSANHRQQVTL